jgi:endonuclease/exonuclease/phosphatase family metal-dependent hydrolase
MPSPANTPVQLPVLTWNVFHGRDFPPDPGLFTRRSRWFRRTISNATHVQVNRSLRREFAQVLAAARWSVCLLQECPPAWVTPLAEACNASAVRTLTSRNQLGFLRRLAGRLNPDLTGASEGGSNVTLFRQPWSLIESRTIVVNPFRERRLRERRRMSLVRLGAGPTAVCVANVHLSTGPRVQTERELNRAAANAVAWAAGEPLLLGGDFNVRPWSSTVYGDLDRRFGLVTPTAPDAIDHLLVCGMQILERPRPWTPARRELQLDTPAGPRRLRLSDHAPVQATFVLDSSRMP